MRRAVATAGARGLALAAAPTFALMAWITGTGGGSAMCSSSGFALPLDSMGAMYLLMSFFHLGPWLRFAMQIAAA